MAKQLLNEFADISALKKQQQQVVGVLDDVTKKLKEMQAMGLSFSKGAKDIETTKDGTKAIDEQAKAMARLETEQKKLVQAQAELYKTEQQAIQVRKEAERQAKLQAQATNEQIGAYKRLEAEAALATAKFKDLAAQFGAESAEAKKAGIEAGALNQRLKDVDATVGQNQRNVGNYKDATVSLRTEIRNLTQTLSEMSMAGKENTKEYNDVAAKLGNLKNLMGEYKETTVSLRTEIRNMTQTLSEMSMAGKENTKEYNDMIAKLGNLKDVMVNVQGRAKFFADDARWITAASSAVQGLVGAYAAYQGVVNLVGEENEDLRKSMMKIQSLMAIMMGLQQVAKTLNKDEAAMTAFRVIKSEALALQLKVVARAEAAKTAAMNAGTIAAKAQAVAWTVLNNVMKLSVIFAVAAAIIGIVMALKKFKESQYESAMATAEFNRQMSMTSEEMKKWDETIKTSLEKLTEAQLAYAVASGRMTQAQADAIRVGEEYKAKYKELTDQFIRDSHQKIMQRDEETRRVTEEYDKALLIAQANSFDVRALEKEKQERLLEIQTQGSEAVQMLLKKHNEALAIEQKIAYQKEKENEIKKQQEKISAYDLLTKNIEALTKKIREEVTVTGEANDADKTRLIRLIDEKEKIDDVVRSIGNFGDAMTLAFTDVFPDDFDKKWDAWLKKLKETPAAIDEVVDEVNGLAVSYSFLDKSMAMLAENNKFGEWIDKNIDNLQKWADMASSVANSITSIMSDSYEKQSGEAEKAHTKEMDSLKKMLDQGIIDQASYDAQSAVLEEKYLAEKEARDKKEFERKKAISIAEGTVKMALALINIWADTGSSTIGKFALSIVAAAELAAQISSMRVASYAKGRDGGPSELAYVGERGYEYVETSTGRLYKTPDTATLTYLNAGDRVYTHSQSVDLEKTLGVNNIPVLSGGKSGQNDYLSSKFDELISVYRNKKEVHMNVSRSGVAMMIKDGNRWTRHINDNVRL